MQRLATYDEVCELLRLSKPTIYRMTCRHEFPTNVYLGKGRFSLDNLERCVNDGTIFRSCRSQVPVKPVLRKNNYKQIIKKAKLSVL